VCGICGIVSTCGEPVDPVRLDAMAATLAHRGPDSAGAVVDGIAGLAARRLSVIDLETGDQPIANEDGTIHVVQNGEVYNYRELRARLGRRGHALRTQGDTEVLVHLYEDEGPRFVERLRGMFALAIWDARQQRLVLARDRFGIKPLHYRLAAGELAFGSELKALPGGEIDPDALAGYLAFNAIPAPYTIYRESRKLPAGHVLTWSAHEGVRVERFARPAPARAADVRAEEPEALAEELRARLRDSVRAHLVADVPVGVLLSGGIDSSTLTALAAAETTGPVRTFSIGFTERSFDELAAARAVAQRFGTDHHELVVEPDAAELLPTLAAVFDEPFADSSAIPTYLVSRLAADHVKVVLSGEGGDELFGGYDTYVADVLAPGLAPLGPLLRPLAAALPSTSGRVSLDYKLKRFANGLGLPPLERHHAWKEIFSAGARATLVAPDHRGGHDPVDLLRARYAETEGADELARLQDVDLGVPLVDDLLVKTDRASMAHSLEARVPFLDPVVADFALGLPAELRVRRFQKKRLLRRAVAPLLPREIVEGRKQGFSIPAAAWLRGALEPFARDVLAPDAIARQGLLDPAAVTAVLDRHVSRREDLSRQLWGLLCLTLWFDVVHTRRAALSAARA
jgi:asparagine synthase (glutamine-hydrolysing)